LWSLSGTGKPEQELAATRRHSVGNIKKRTKLEGTNKQRKTLA